MDAVVNLKMTVGELDTIRVALKELAENRREAGNNVPNGKLRSDLRAEEAQAKLLAEKLG